jgi:PIN domain nuclease of toxin-antitoxin system
VRLLLDTHVAIWVIQEDRRLPGRVNSLIADARNEVWVSAVSIWEIAVKFALDRRGLGRMPVSGPRALQIFKDTNFELLDLTPEHALAVADLPQIHADPFDRLLVAQSIAEPMRLITHDETVARYNDTIILF